MAMRIFTGQCDNYYVTDPIVKTFEVLPHGCVGTAVWDNYTKRCSHQWAWENYI